MGPYVAGIEKELRVKGMAEGNGRKKGVVTLCLFIKGNPPP